MTYFSVDVEANGPCPGLYSMVSFGMVRLDRELKTRFFAQLAPLAGANAVQEAYSVIGITPQEHWMYPSPHQAMLDAADWLKENNTTYHPQLISDNPAFDWQFINYYFCAALGPKGNPFGYSARRIGDIYSGLMKNGNEQNAWKRFRRAAHTHHPVDDALGNAEAVLHMVDNMGFKL